VKTVDLYSNLSLEDFADAPAARSLTTFLVPETAASAREKTIQLADKLKSSGYKVGVEIKVEGLQRSRRIPLIAVKNSTLHLLKVCLDETKIEESLHLQKDMKSSVQQVVGPNTTIQSHVIYDGLLNARLVSLAQEFGVDIYSEEVAGDTFN